MAAGIGLIYVLGSTSVTDGFQKLEQRDATVSVSRVHDAVNQRIDALDRCLLVDQSFADQVDRNLHQD